MHSPWLKTWLSIGAANPWIAMASDPSFNADSVSQVQDKDELRAVMVRGNWCLGQAFVLDDVCFINQVNGGDEWLTIRRGIDFESASLGHMIKAGNFDNFMARIRRATDDQLRSLEY